MSIQACPACSTCLSLQRLGHLIDCSLESVAFLFDNLSRVFGKQFQLALSMT